MKYVTYSTPAAPASAPPSANVNAIVRLTSMPISRAASVSWAVARIALPWRVLRTTSTSASSTGMVISTTSSDFRR